MRATPTPAGFWRKGGPGSCTMAVDLPDTLIPILPRAKPPAVKAECDSSTQVEVAVLLSAGHTFSHFALAKPPPPSKRKGTPVKSPDEPCGPTQPAVPAAEGWLAGRPGMQAGSSLFSGRRRAPRSRSGACRPIAKSKGAPARQPVGLGDGSEFC